MRDAVDIWIKFTKFLLTYLILNLVFHLQIFSYEVTFFVRKQQKVGLDPTFFTLKKVANQGEFSKKVASYKKNRKWRTSLISRANGSKVVHLSADPNADPFKGQFPLSC